MKPFNVEATNMENFDIEYHAHGCDITIKGRQITVKEGVEEITADIESDEWNIRTFILGQIHGILSEYTPSELYKAILYSDFLFNKG